MSDHIQNASKAFSNFTTFHAIIQICEGGLFYGSRPNKPLSEIIKICRLAAIKELSVYDAARAKANGCSHD